MKILNFDEINNDFDERIFENSRADLITKLSKYPSRYIGIFRSSTPRTKLIQNITQSHEIKFGDGFEILIRKLFEKFGFESLKLNRKLNNGDTISFDQLMKKENDLLFIEQKVRDDHDSTKKRGQFKNFKVKLDYLVANESFDTLRSYIYFIDSSLTKNKNNQLLVEGELLDISQLKEGAKRFISNNGVNPNLSDNPDKKCSKLSYRVLKSNPSSITTPSTGTLSLGFTFI